MISNLLRACSIAVALLLSMHSGGWAHAIVLSSTPSLDATLTGPDIVVRVKFNSRIDHTRSRLSLVDARNKAQDLPLDKDGPVDAISSKATGVAPGRYRIRWQVLAIDGHITRGDIPFTVTAR